MKNSRSVRKPSGAEGINFHLVIFYGFERRKHDAFLDGIGADSKCVTNTVV